MSVKGVTNLELHLVDLYRITNKKNCAARENLKKIIQKERATCFEEITKKKHTSDSKMHSSFMFSLG